MSLDIPPIEIKGVIFAPEALGRPGMPLYEPKDKRLTIAKQKVNFGNAKRALVPERSNSLRPTFREGEWTVKATFADDDVVFEAGVLNGGSIWKDPALKNVVCLAGPLGDAMRETGILTGFNGLGDMRKGLIAVG